MCPSRCEFSGITAADAVVQKSSEQCLLCCSSFSLKCPHRVPQAHTFPAGGAVGEAVECLGGAAWLEEVSHSGMGLRDSYQLLPPQPWATHTETPFPTTRVCMYTDIPRQNKFLPLFSSFRCFITVISNQCGKTGPGL